MDKPHIAYAVVGVFATCFSLCSLFVKEKLYLGEASVAMIYGLIVGPHCLNWFNPLSWGNVDNLTLELSRMLLIIEIFAISVELPKKYVMKHWFSLFMFLVPVMTFGWLVIGLFIWAILPGITYPNSLLISACITATDPVLAQAVVGSGKFAKRVPGHLRNILNLESASNDGMAVPFVYLSMNIVVYGSSHAGEIAKEWVLVTLLYECVLGVVLGIVIGYVARISIRFAERKELIDRESFLAFYICVAFICAGFGSMLGVDDLLVSFSAGTAFAWDGWFSQRTEDAHISTVIDLLLNLAYFIYFGSIIPWEQFDNDVLGLDVWRLVCLGIVVLFMRRIPAVLALWKIIPDVKSWREALFCGHFGPIGVGAVYAVMIARSGLEAETTHEATPLAVIPTDNEKYSREIEIIWPVVTFLILTSIIVHGSSVAVMTLGKHLNTVAFTMSFTQTKGDSGGTSWMSRLPKLETSGRSFSLHRMDEKGESKKENPPLSSSSTVETSGVPAKPAGGMRKRHKKRAKKKERPVPEELDLGKKRREREEVSPLDETEDISPANSLENSPEKSPEDSTENSHDNSPENSTPVKFSPEYTAHDIERQEADQEVEISPEDAHVDESGDVRRPSMAYEEGNSLIIEDQHGEIMDTLKPNENPADQSSVHSFNSLKKKLTNYSFSSDANAPSAPPPKSKLGNLVKRAFLGSGTRKDDPDKRKFFAFRVDDQIMIENSQGDIIRRYKLNMHKKEPTSSSADVSMAKKALSLVGIKPSKANKVVSDIEQNQQTNTQLIPEDGQSHVDPEVEKSMEKHLSQVLSKSQAEKGKLPKAAALHLPRTMSPAPPRVETESETEGSEVSDGSYDDESDNSVESETEAERSRRLAALYTSQRHQSDEEEPM